MCPSISATTGRFDLRPSCFLKEAKQRFDSDDFKELRRKVVSQKGDSQH